MSRVDDHCTNGRILPISVRRCRGIVHLHATCNPPCDRKLAAEKYLVEAT